MRTFLRYLQSVLFLGMCFGLAWTGMVSATVLEQCFIAQEKGKVIQQIGSCDKRHPPFETFHIPVALMGFDAGILLTPHTPLVAFTADIEKSFAPYFHPQKEPFQWFAKRSQTPASWMQYGVLWYTHTITQKLGADTMQGYVHKWGYGNQQLGAGTDKTHAVIDAWFNHTLLISPVEQLAFTDALRQRTVSATAQAHDHTTQLINRGMIWDAWELYGIPGGTPEMGWFVGWIQKGDRQITFVQWVRLPNQPGLRADRVAFPVAHDHLIPLIF